MFRFKPRPRLTKGCNNRLNSALFGTGHIKARLGRTFWA